MTRRDLWFTLGGMSVFGCATMLTGAVKGPLTVEAVALGLGVWVAVAIVQYGILRHHPRR
jgi:hypothetical protein